MSDPRDDKTDNADKPDELAGTEQPFVQHLMELRDRMIRAVAAIGIAAIALAIFPGPGALYDLMAAPLVASGRPIEQAPLLAAVERPLDGYCCPVAYSQTTLNL